MKTFHIVAVCLCLPLGHANQCLTIDIMTPLLESQSESQRWFCLCHLIDRLLYFGVHQIYVSVLSDIGEFMCNCSHLGAKFLGTGTLIVVCVLVVWDLARNFVNWLCKSATNDYHIVYRRLLPKSTKLLGFLVSPVRRVRK